MDFMICQICFNVFDMNCVVYQLFGLWWYLDDWLWQYNMILYWMDLVKLFEGVIFDGIFIVDVLGIYDVYGGMNEVVICNGVQVLVNDLIFLVSVMVVVMENLGFGIMVGIVFEYFYFFVWCLSMFDYFMQGWIGWNVVIGYLFSVVCNMGQEDQFVYDDCYDYVDEYVEVFYKFWEGLWEDDVVVEDCECGIFIDLVKVYLIGYEGKYFSVFGIYIFELLLQCMLVIYQVGVSLCGVRFVVENVEVIFVVVLLKEVFVGIVKCICDVFEVVGCDWYDVCIYMLFMVIIVVISEEVIVKYVEYFFYVSLEGVFMFMLGWMGVDFLQYVEDELVGNVELNVIQFVLQYLKEEVDFGCEWIVGDFGCYNVIGGLGFMIVGLGEEIVDELQLWVEEIDIDGFNFVYVVILGMWEDVIEYVILVLWECGVYLEEYVLGMFCNKFYGCGDCVQDMYCVVKYCVGVFVKV